MLKPVAFIFPLYLPLSGKVHVLQQQYEKKPFRNQIARVLCTFVTSPIERLRGLDWRAFASQSIGQLETWTTAGR